MIDEGEADWKVVAIDAEDKWAPFLNEIDDVERELPGTLNAIREWFRTYKMPDGKPPNRFGLDEKFMHKTYALGIIKECNRASSLSYYLLLFPRHIILPSHKVSSIEACQCPSFFIELLFVVQFY